MKNFLKKLAIATVSIFLVAGVANAASILQYYGGGTGTSSQINGIVKSNGTVFSAAVSGTDYLPITGGTSVTTLGTIGTGIWQGNPIGTTYGGTGCSSASVTCFNNITGYTASGATGTTSTNLVFSGSPTIATPTFTTSLTSPLHIGSTSANGTLTFEGNNTTGNTAGNANLIFKVGDSAGTTAMTILNSGNVGIGTTNPAARLDIAGVAGNLTSPTVQIGSLYGGITAYSDTYNNEITLGGAYGTQLKLWNQDAGQPEILSNSLLHIRTLGADYIDFGTNNTERARIDSAGNVGVGTTSPLLKLDVNGPVLFAGSTGGTTVDGALIYNNSIHAYEYYDASTASWLSLAGGDITVTGGYWNPNGSDIYYTAGHVGIGTTTPTSNFEVSDNVNVPLITATSSGADAAISLRNTSTGGREYWIDSGAAGAGVGEGNFAIFDPAASATRFAITSSGNVGIATTSPTNILSLGGNSAQTFWMERHTTANTAGNSLTIQSGGATAAATDKNGGALVLAPGASTGTGFNSLRLQSLSRATSTGTSDNTLEDRVIIPSVSNLTNNTAVGLFDVALPTLSMAGGSIDYTIISSDGTDMQSISGNVKYDAVNKGGSYTTQFTPTNDTAAVSAGTLVPTWSVVSGTNKVTIKVSIASSLTPTILQIRYVLHNTSSSAITQL